MSDKIGFVVAGLVLAAFGGGLLGAHVEHDRQRDRWEGVVVVHEGRVVENPWEMPAAELAHATVLPTRPRLIGLQCLRDAEVVQAILVQEEDELPPCKEIRKLTAAELR